MPDIFTAKEKELQKKEMPQREPQKETERALLLGHTHNPLAAFSYYPDPNKTAFETQDREEKVVLLLRKHPITNIGWILIATFMLLGPVVLNSFPLLAFLPANFQFIAILAWYLVTTAFILENFLSWFFNVYIITDERVVDVDFYNLIYKQVSDAKIDKIQDVTYNMGGAIRTIFNYGNVLIQTAAEVNEFEFGAVPRPDKVAKVLQELMIEEEQEKIEGRVR
jgi:uncharacterized membrane protein YdbT with pleckstrin-like domain